MSADFTENWFCTMESSGLTRECLAAKFMKIVMVMCGFRSRPIMWLSPRWLCLLGKGPATKLDDFFYYGYGCIYARRYEGQIV